MYPRTDVSPTGGPMCLRIDVSPHLCVRVPVRVRLELDTGTHRYGATGMQSLRQLQALGSPIDALTVISYEFARAIPQSLVKS